MIKRKAYLMFENSSYIQPRWKRLKIKVFQLDPNRYGPKKIGIFFPSVNLKKITKLSKFKKFKKKKTPAVNYKHHHK